MEKKKTIGLMAIGGFTAIGLAFTALAFSSNSLPSFVTGATQSENKIVLNSSNKVTSAGDSTKQTAKGNDVVFTYSNVANSTSGHVTLNSTGYLVNKSQITSIESVIATFSGSGTLKFKVSYDGATWGSETTMTSAYQYELDSNPYYIQISAFSSSVTINTLDIEFSCVTNPNAAPQEVEDLPTVSYQKITAAGNLESGKEYLIVYEDSEDVSKAFDGSLSSLDATENYVEVEITDDVIEASAAINAATFTIASVSGGYSIRSSSGLYIGNASDSNGLTTSGSALTNTITFSSGDAVIRGSGGAYLRFNNTNNQNRFRYYKSSTYSSQQPISLYKKVSTSGGSHIEYNTPDNEIIGFTATDSKANSYKTTDVFDTANGLTVVANLTGDTTQPLSKGGENGYSYVVKNSSNVAIDTSVAFGGLENSTYTLIVSYKNFIPQEIQLSVEFIKALTSISDVSTSPNTFTTAQKLQGNLNNLTATLHYNNGDSEVVTYASFAEKGLEVILLNPSSVTYNQNTVFGTAGEWTIRVRSTTNNAIYSEIPITVNAIPVSSVSLNQTEASIEEGKTLQLVVTVAPDDATNKNVEWSTSSSSIATVDSNGLVTGVSAGTATITATSLADGTKYGSCLVTVTEKQVGADEGLFVLNTSGASTVGSYVVFGNTMSNGTGYAMSSTQATNNRPGVSVTIADKTIERTSTSTFRAFKVEEGTSSGTVSFYDEEADGYLYAASSSGNQLKTETTKSANSSWAVSGSESKTIVAQGSNTRNRLKWNSSASVFSCYASGQVDTYIYEKAGDPVYATSISISGSNSVAVGGQTQLSVSYVPNDTTVKAVTWTTSDDLVAGVSNGLVTGIKAGTATITAKVKGEGGADITATKTITVNNVSVTSVSLDKATASITEGNTVTLVHTISPENATNKAVTWSTSDNSVATVDEGVVTGRGAGTATITVTTADGNKTASCNVTVTASGGSQAETLSISYSDLPTAYDTSGNVRTASSGLKFIAYNCAHYSNSKKMQFKASGGYVCNTEALELNTITLNNRETNVLTVYGGSSSHPTTNKITGTNDVYDLSGYHYFTIVKEGTGAAYCTDVVVEVGTPEPTNPTSITISPSSAEIAVGGSKTLSVNYTPSDANQNKAVTWSSNNTNVATVDSSGKVTVKSTASVGQSATITATLTNLPTIKATCSISVIDTPNADHTVLIYICGADLESNNSLATGDIQEILKVNGQPDDVNIVIETGGASSWASTYGISSKYLQRHHVQNKQLITDQASITYASMGLSSTLQSFLEYGIENYPADKYGLILWNHGGGMHGVCYDEKKSDDSLLSYEVKNAVSGALSAKGMSGQKLEWIGYDACLMAVQDIAEMNSQYFNYMVASEESEAGYGWDYDNWVDDLYAKKTTPNILKAIVDTFISDNGGASSSSGDQTLSYMNLSYASAYKTAWENLASALQSKLTSSNKAAFNTAIINNVKHFADSDYDYFCLFDAKDFINKLVSNSSFSNYRVDSSYTTAVTNALSNFVAYSVAQKGAGNAYGVCMYWPNNSTYSDMSVYSTSCTNFTTWRSVCNTYGVHK